MSRDLICSECDAEYETRDYRAPFRCPDCRSSDQSALDPSTGNPCTYCVCGHRDIDHHTSWFPGGGVIREECEAFGYNDTGGMRNENGEWVEHCNHFRPVLTEEERAHWAYGSGPNTLEGGS